MPRDAFADPTFIFLRAVWALDHGLQSQSKRMKARAGVTGPQRLVLRLLELAPDTAPSELARILFFDKSTVTVILRSLEKANLVERSSNVADRRAVALSLTPKGRKIVQKRSGTVEDVFRRTLAKLPARDLDIARRVLETLAHAFS